MKVKFADKIYEVLYTKEVAGKTMYAVEDEPNHIDWLVNVEVIDEAEQKYVPLKFNVGDWIVYDDTVCKIYKTSPNDNFYHCFDINDCIHIYNRSLEDKMHLWTIQDAKDGDILWHSDSASNGVFIFKEIRNDGKILCYCDYDSEDHFCLGEYHTCCWTSSKYVMPATKEQRDLLFAKMKEADYEWDEEKKELKKLEKQNEQKLIWDKFDDLMLKDVLEFIETGWSGNGKSHLIYWLKSIKDRIK
jgi:hypothetical protein